VTSGLAEPSSNQESNSKSQNEKSNIKNLLEVSAMATEAQINANRSNAQKSTGPRTKVGKAVVAQNAIKHGLFAHQDVIAEEDPQQYEEHRRRFLAELSPAGEKQGLLAGRIVSLAWRLKRAERLQTDELKGSGTFSGPSFGTWSRGQLESLGGGQYPARLPQRRTASDALAYDFDVRRVQALMHESRPVQRPFHRPVGQAEGTLAPATHRKTRPWPLRRPADQPGAQRIAFDISQHSQTVQIILHRETLVPTLVQMPDPHRAMRGMTSLGAGLRCASQEGRQVPVLWFKCSVRVAALNGPS
jgi:hypothetical protein